MHGLVAIAISITPCRNAITEKMICQCRRVVSFRQKILGLLEFQFYAHGLISVKALQGKEPPLRVLRAHWFRQIRHLKNSDQSQSPEKALIF